VNRIVVVGSLNMDLVVQTNRFPQIGETILGSGFMISPGGKGANQAVAASRLGAHVSMIGCIGRDIFGENLLKNLRENNVEISDVEVIEQIATGVAMIILKDGDNLIIVDSGANSSLSVKTVEDKANFIKNNDILMVQLEIPFETVERVVDIAKDNGIKVLLNPAPARKLSDAFLSKIDIITPNETECEIITGINVKSVEDAKKAVLLLLKKGIKQIIITMGSKGVVYNSGNEIIHKPVHEVNVVDTTAAGDSFSGAIAVAISQGKGIDDAVDFGNIVGTLTVTKKGAQNSLPTLNEVQSFISKRGI